MQFSNNPIKDIIFKKKRGRKRKMKLEKIADNLSEVKNYKEEFNINFPKEKIDNNNLDEKVKPHHMLKCIKDVEIEDPKFLWYPFVQSNNITILRGDGGVGKTYLVCALAATVSNNVDTLAMSGKVLDYGNVIYFGREDGDNTIRTRFSACGGNVDRFFTFSEPFEMKDTDLLTDIIRTVNAKLVIFDPLQAYIGININMNNANHTRPILEGIRSVAKKENCAILIIEHQNKMTQQKNIYRGIGSADILASARSVLMLGYHPTAEDTRVLLQLKSNTIKGDPEAFRINTDGSIDWIGSVNVTEEQVAMATGKHSTNSEKKEPVVEVVKAILSENPNGWKGTASEISTKAFNLTKVNFLTPQMIGARLPKIISNLCRLGIGWNSKNTKNGTIHELFYLKSDIC